jgi:hypothetical protein
VLDQSAVLVDLRGVTRKIERDRPSAAAQDEGHAAVASVPA